MVNIFEQGDILLINFDSQIGHEQKGRRPAFVVSNNTFNKFTRMAIVCPITNTDRKIPIQVKLDNKTKTKGVVMCEQVKFLDLSKRGAIFLEKAPLEIVSKVVEMVLSFVEIE